MFYQSNIAKKATVETVVAQVSTVDSSTSTKVQLPVREEELVRRIGPGDVLHIAVRNEPDLERTLHVYPEGSILYSIGGKIKVSGLTLLEVEEEIRSRISQYVPNPEVSVSLE